MKSIIMQSRAAKPILQSCIELMRDRMRDFISDKVKQVDNKYKQYLLGGSVYV